MRLALVSLLFLTGLGCKGVPISSHEVVHCPPGGPGTSPGTALTHCDDDCPITAAGHSCSICTTKEKEKPKDRGGPRDQSQLHLVRPTFWNFPIGEPEV